MWMGRLETFEMRFWNVRSATTSMMPTLDNGNQLLNMFGSDFFVFRPLLVDETRTGECDIGGIHDCHDTWIKVGAFCSSLVTNTSSRGRGYAVFGWRGLMYARMDTGSE